MTPHEKLRDTLLALPPDRTLTSGELLRMAGSVEAVEQARLAGIIVPAGSRWVVVREDVSEFVTRLRDAGLHDVVSRVCESYGVTLESILMRDRTSNVSAARMAVYAALWELPNRRHTLAEIARMVGRSKPTVHDGIVAHARRIAAPRKAGERVRGARVAA